jgi:hypothetical protein
MIRFEILIPQFYNDGRTIEPEKFFITYKELIQQFGAISTDTALVQGQWTYQSVVYSDQLSRIRLDVQDIPENWEAMRRTKEILKVRFEQVDIWITAHRIEII